MKFIINLNFFIINLLFSGQYSELPGEAVLINFFGVTIVVFAVLVVYLVTKEDYARPVDPIN